MTAQLEIGGPAVGLSQTPVMEKGNADPLAYQCSWCGCLLVYQAEKKPNLGACPACAKGKWQSTYIPVGPFRDFDHRIIARSLEARACMLEANGKKREARVVREAAIKATEDLRTTRKAGR